MVICSIKFSVPPFCYLPSPDRSHWHPWRDVNLCSFADFCVLSLKHPCHAPQVISHSSPGKTPLSATLTPHPSEWDACPGCLCNDTPRPRLWSPLCLCVPSPTSTNQSSWQTESRCPRPRCKKSRERYLTKSRGQIHHPTQGKTVKDLLSPGSELLSPEVAESRDGDLRWLHPGWTLPCRCLWLLRSDIGVFLQPH